MRIVLNTRLYEIYISRDLENNYLKENNCEAYRYNQHEVVDSLQILLCFWRPGNLIFSNNIFFSLQFILVTAMQTIYQASNKLLLTSRKLLAHELSRLSL